MVGHVMSKSEFMARYINDYYKRWFAAKELANVGRNYTASRIVDSFNSKIKRKKRGIL